MLFVLFVVLEVERIFRGWEEEDDDHCRGSRCRGNVFELNPADNRHCCSISNMRPTGENCKRHPPSNKEWNRLPQNPFKIQWPSPISSKLFIFSVHPLVRTYDENGEDDSLKYLYFALHLIQIISGKNFWISSNDTNSEFEREFDFSDERLYRCLHRKKVVDTAILVRKPRWQGKKKRRRKRMRTDPFPLAHSFYFLLRLFRLSNLLIDTKTWSLHHFVWSKCSPHSRLDSLNGARSRESTTCGRM